MGSHLLGLANSSQLQYSKHFKMKLPLIIAATVAVALAGPQHLRSYSVGSHLRGRYSGQALRSQGLRTYSNYQNYLTKTPVPFSEPYRLDDPSNRDAMVAFINQAVNDREAFFDPVCGAATIARLDEKIAGKSDKEAGAASAEAYIEAFAANGGKRTEACKRSAEAYIKTF